MNSSSKNSGRGSVCSANHFAGGLHSQSPQSHLKRFIMFDHSGGKGRMFFHPALAQELFGSSKAPECDLKDCITEKGSNVKLLAYRQMVEGAFASLQTLRASRRKEMSFVRQPNATCPLSGTLTSSQKPRVFESLTGAGTSWAQNDKDTAQKCMVSQTLICEEKAKVSAIPPSTEKLQDCKASAPLFSSSSQLSGTKNSDVAAGSDSMRENTEDLDALLSSDEDEDEDVRSTGHSPDKSLCKGDSLLKDEDEEVEQLPSKRRKVDGQRPNELGHDCDRAGEEVNDKMRFLCNQRITQNNRRQKIKTTVKALRKTIPGGAHRDAVRVLDETIMYVKTLRDRVNQLEATRFQSHLYL